MRRAPQFYRVRFADSKVLGEWTIRVLQILASGQNTASEASMAHPVILVPLRVPRRGAVCGYVNESARPLVRGLVRGVRLDGTAKSAAELPDGLTLLRADAAEAEVYEYRVTRARKSG